MTEIPMKGGDEYDALTRWKKYLHWSPGQRKAIKRGYRRRCRRLAKENIQSDLSASE
jgi:hypothetical protein